METGVSAGVDAGVGRLGRGAAALRRVCLGELVARLLTGRAMERFFKDGLLLIDLKLGLEVANVVREVAAVGAAAGVGKAEVLVHDFLPDVAPLRGGELFSMIGGS